MSGPLKLLVISLIALSTAPAAGRPTSDLSLEGQKIFRDFYSYNNIVPAFRSSEAKRAQLKREIEAQLSREQPDWRTVERLSDEAFEEGVKQQRHSHELERKLLRKFSESDRLIYLRDVYLSKPPVVLVSQSHQPEKPKLDAVSGSVVPRTKLADLITLDDYPGSSLQFKEQGSVGVRLDVLAGRVTQCAITHSSGARTLDETTCRIIRSRARFTPARDPQGRPVRSTFDDRVDWILPVQ